MSKKVKNPMGKRLPRELRHDFGKYIVIFLFIAMTIGLVSGFLVSNSSVRYAYDESFEKYNVEDGHFTLAMPASDELIEKLEKEDISVYENFYSDKETGDGDTVRIYKIREDVNRADLMEGELPKTYQQIVIDRLYAEKNGISIGDTIQLDGKIYTVSGFIALSDYSALFKNNTDMMFDASDFCVAMVISEEFNSYPYGDVNYCYAWTNNDKNLTDDEINDKADDITDILAANTIITDFVKQSDNQAIMFTGEDMGSDRTMMIVLLFIVMMILAFIFAVTTSNTIEQESAVIGTLRASGYTKGELLRHYMALPVIVSMAAAVVGNILGYTLFKDAVADMLYDSYSLTTYRTLWNPEAFLLTTVMPLVIMLAVNGFVLIRKLSLSPLKFLRRDLSRKAKKKAVRLPNIPFISRFRLRVIFQNMPSYITLFIGILLANILLLFGMMMSPLLDNFNVTVLDSKIADYQYILKAAVSTSDSDAEKYCVTSLNDKPSDEEIMVYGIAEDSEYLPELELSDKADEVIASEGYLEKYGYSIGDTITLKDKYSGDEYELRIADSFNYPAALAVFMSDDSFKDAFDKDDDYFTGYFSNKKLTDIDDMYIASTITEHDLVIVANQLNDSMGEMFVMVNGFSVLLYMLMVYMLSKLVLEKNAASISMVKILGYNSGEIGKLYITSTAWVVVIALLISLPASYYMVRWLYSIFMMRMTGWLTYYVEPIIFIKMFVIGLVSYWLISLLHYRKIKKIPMEKALKNVE